MCVHFSPRSFCLFEDSAQNLNFRRCTTPHRHRHHFKQFERSRWGGNKRELAPFARTYAYIVARDFTQQFIYDSVRYADAMKTDRQPPTKYVEEVWRTVACNVRRMECSCDWVPCCPFHGSLLDELVWKTCEVVKVAVDSNQVIGPWQDCFATIVSRIHAIFRDPMDPEYSEMRLAASAYAHWMVHHKLSFAPDEIFSSGDGHTCTLMF